MVERAKASSPEKVPSLNAVPAVSSMVESQLRSLLRMEAAMQRHELDERRRKAIEAGTHDPKEKQKMGWAEQLQTSARSRIQLAMQQREVSESETLNDGIVAAMLRGIIETGKLGKMDVPSEMRKVIADFCARKGTPEHWWPAALRMAWCLELGRSFGLTKKPEGIDLLPETRAFLGGLDYEYGQSKTQSKEIGVEGRAQRGPRQIAARMESRVPIIRDNAVEEFDARLEKFVMKPPTGEEARKEHFEGVIHAIDVATRTLDNVATMDVDRKRNLSLRMTTAKTRIAQKTGAA